MGQTGSPDCERCEHEPFQHRLRIENNRLAAGTAHNTAHRAAFHFGGIYVHHRPSGSPGGNYPMTVGRAGPILIDERFGDGPRYHLTEPKDIRMRVPDQIRDCVLFVGVPEIPDPEYRGTAFIVSVPGTQQNDFVFVVTARHVAEKLEGSEFYIRANKRDGTAVALRGHADNQWWYHPTEREYVDAAVTVFPAGHLSELAVDHIPLQMFADEGVIAGHNIGIGDDVFITGLFTKVTETTKNIPIVRTGTVAMIPGEKIPFGDSMIEAYLVESRSFGGLSGSPVFVRETLKIYAGIEANPDFGIHGKDSKNQMFVGQEMQGIGKFFFFGSMIGHWEIRPGFSLTEAEAVNMGIAPIVPAHKIKEILLQPELVDMMKKADAEIAAKKRSGAKLDFAPGKREELQKLTREDFQAALTKVTRKVSK